MSPKRAGRLKLVSCWPLRSKISYDKKKKAPSQAKDCKIKQACGKVETAAGLASENSIEAPLALQRKTGEIWIEGHQNSRNLPGGPGGALMTMSKSPSDSEAVRRSDAAATVCS